MTQITTPTVTQAAHWGLNDPEVERIWMLFKEATSYILDPKMNDEADFQADRIYEKLVIARNHYIAINDPAFNKRPTTARDGEYDALYAALWSSYKDRLPRLTVAIGYNIQFAYASERQFTAQAEAFIQNHPDQAWLVNYIKIQRQAWQNDLSRHRNAREHDGDLRHMKDAEDIQTPAHARKMFVAVTDAIEGIGISLLSYVLPTIWTVEIIDKYADVFKRTPRFAIRNGLMAPTPKESA